MTGSTFDRSVDLFRMERGDEKGAAGGIGFELVAIGKLHRNARSEASADVENREGRAFPTDDFARQEKNAGRGRGRRLILRLDGYGRRKGHQEQRERSQAAKRGGHTEIVVENRLGQKGEAAVSRWQNGLVENRANPYLNRSVPERGGEFVPGKQEYDGSRRSRNREDATQGQWIVAHWPFGQW